MADVCCFLVARDVNPLSRLDNLAEASLALDAAERFRLTPFLDEPLISTTAVRSVSADLGKRDEARWRRKDNPARSRVCNLSFPGSSFSGYRFSDETCTAESLLGLEKEVDLLLSDKPCFSC